jgi:hypothetical protein
MRRLALPLGALVAAVSFSSCSSVDHADVAAEVNGHELTTDQLSVLADGSTDGEAIRGLLRTWIEVVAVSDDASGLTTATELTARKTGLLADMVEQFADAGRTTYEQGLDGSPLLCLSAIPLDTSVEADTVLAELRGGTTFADAAKQYSIDTSLADSGGVVTSADGIECLAADQYNTELLSALADAGATVGEPASIVLQSQQVIVLLRPFDELTLSDAEKVQLSSEQMGAALSERYASAKVRVDPRFGTWDAGTGQVVALGAPAGNS